MPTVHGRGLGAGRRARRRGARRRDLRARTHQLPSHRGRRPRLRRRTRGSAHPGQRQRVVLSEIGLPGPDQDPQGAIRIGTQTIVRQGFGPAEMAAVAAVMAGTLRGERPVDVLRADVAPRSVALSAPLSRSGWRHEIGVPTEIKTDEYRVALTPAGVARTRPPRPPVLVETGAGLGSAIPDDAFVAAGREIVADADGVCASADMIVKVKEPQPPSSRCCARTRSCSPTCTSPPTGAPQALVESGVDGHRLRDRAATRRRAAAADPDERGRRPHGDRRPGASISRRRTAAAACCSAACPASRPAKVVDPRRRRRRLRTPPRSPLGLGARRHGPRPSTSTACATSTTISTPLHDDLLATR